MRKVSVIIPAFNEEKWVGRAVRSVLRQRVPEVELEVVVVDNESTDETRERALDAGALVQTCSIHKVGAVRNHGVRYATGDLIGFLDGDCEAQGAWISTAIAALADSSVGAVGGPCEAPQSASWVVRTYVGKRKRQEGEVKNLAASSLLMSIDTFTSIGGFSEDVEAGEDDEISARLRKAGKKLLSLDGCSVIHNAYPGTLRELFKKQLWHGRNQIEAAEGKFEPMLIVTHIYLACLCMVAPASIAMIIESTQQVVNPLVVTLMLMLAMITAFSAFKVLKSDRDLLRFLAYLPIGAIYLTAKAIALAGNHLDRLRGR